MKSLSWQWDFLTVMLNNLLSAETADGASEAWLALLREYKLVEPDRRVRYAHNDNVVGISSPETSAPRPRLAASPWRSVGGYLDYSEWAARERFVELDKAIAAFNALVSAHSKPDTA
jgi:hypothetical protein